MAFLKEVGVVFVFFLTANAFSISCEICTEETVCPVMKCDGVKLIPDLCGCCEVCAGGVGESCGAITDNLCDDSLICAKPLLEFQPRPAIYEIKLDEYWVSTGTCQDPDTVHKCQLEGSDDDLCSGHGTCFPEGDDHICRCDETWTGKDCSEPEIKIFRPVLVGGYDDWKDANDDVQSIADSVRSSAEKLKGSFLVFKAVSYKAQVVAGMNYRIRMDVGMPTYLEIVVYKHFSGSTSLTKADITDELILSPVIEECQHGQEFMTCGTACPRMCGKPQPFICTMQCVIGCQCPLDMWQKEDGSCVGTAAECYDDDEECPHNQEFNNCGTTCPKICGQPEPFLCTMQCEVGCQCPWGWWQKEDGTCVEHKEECFALECQDDNDSCEHWASIGECCNNPGYMLSSCAKSCGQCGSNPDISCTCEDNDDQCPDWAADGECCKNEAYMLENCKKSCSQCGEINELPGCPCMNFDSNCEGWAEAGECESNPGFMNKKCAKVCGACEIEFVTCESNPCPEGCHCDDSAGSYECMCPLIDPIIIEEPYVKQPIVDAVPVWKDEE